MTKIQLALKMFDIGMENEYKENKRNSDPTRNTCFKMLHRRHTDPKPNRILMSNTILVARSWNSNLSLILSKFQISEYRNISVRAHEHGSKAPYHPNHIDSNEFTMKTNEIFIEYDLSFSMNISTFQMFSMLLHVGAM